MKEAVNSEKTSWTENVFMQINDLQSQSIKQHDIRGTILYANYIFMSKHYFSVNTTKYDYIV